MRKIRFDRKYLKISSYLLIVIVLALIFQKLIDNFEVLLLQLDNIFAITQKVLAPFIYGAFIAYFINPIVRTIENKLFIRNKLLENRVMFRRSMSILISYVIFISFIICIIAYVLPEILSSMVNLMYSLPETVRNAQIEIESMVNNNEYLKKLNIKDTGDIIDMMFAPFADSSKAADSINGISNVVSKILNQTVTIAGTLLNSLLGIIIAFYFLMAKEGFAAYMQKFLYVLFDTNLAMKIVDVTRKSNKVFEQFLIGKAIDSTIIGILCFIILSIINPPYILLFSVIVGVTNMIPFFGPFIGGIPVVIVTLFYDPWTALWVGVAIFGLQQFDGYILGPKILGESTGLSALWVIFSILVGGQLFGVMGMLFGVPCFAVIKTILDEILNRKFKEKYGEQNENKG